ncbi:hypothetical protein SLA2020_286750, partial [Shorea laevis]
LFLLQRFSVVAGADPQAGVHDEVLSGLPEGFEEGIRLFFGGQIEADDHASTLAEDQEVKGRGWRANARAMVNWTEEASRGPSMLEMLPLAVLSHMEWPQSVAPAWVVKRVMEFCHVVVLSRDGIEDKLVALFNDIDASVIIVGRVWYMRWVGEWGLEAFGN